MEPELKIGARNSAKDAERLQMIHDYAKENGANCGPKSIEIDEDDLIAYGGEVKAIGQVDGGVKVKGCLVRFTNPDEPDLTGDYFDAKTDFDIDEFPAKSTAYFNHGMDAHFKRRKLEPVTLTQDEFGIWAEGVLHERDEYEKFLIGLTEAGKLGLSSGVPGHLVEREPMGKAMHITAWPLGKDASYTHTPAESRNIVTLKSLLPVEQPEASQEGEAEATPSTIIVTNPKKEGTKMEMTQEEIKALVADTAKAAVEEYRKSEPAPKGPAITIEVDEAEQPFKSKGEFFMAVKNAALYPNQEDRRLRSLKAASGANEGIPSQGGYLVSQEIAAGIFQRVYSTGAILSRCANDVVGPNSNGMVYNAIDESSRADGSRMGGVLGYWVGEATAPTATKPKFRQVALKLKKVGALCYATDELLEDAVALDSWINRSVPQELAFKMEDAIYNGDGVAKPLGILTSPCLVTVTRDTGGKVLLADILAMWARRWAGVSDYVWLCGQDTWSQLPQLYLANQPLFMPPGGITGQPYGSIFGRPVIENEYSPALNAKGDIMLASLSQYQTITKGGVNAASSIHVLFTTDETAFRFIARIDGAPMWASTLTPKNAGNTLSPFVVLGAASA
jgi:HK97 family phage major capsid protein